MRIFSQNCGVQLLQVKSVLSLANIAFLCHIFTQSCEKTLFKTGFFALHWSPFCISRLLFQPSSWTLIH